jgi:hypothetical protein
MSLHNWSRSNVDYGRKLVTSGLEGARFGEEAFLHGKSLRPFIQDSARNALAPAAIGLCIGGLLAQRPGNGHNPSSRRLTYGLMGGAIGFCVGLAWEIRRLAAGVAAGAWQNVHRVRDEHWLEKNPIDYA